MAPESSKRQWHVILGGQHSQHSSLFLLFLHHFSPFSVIFPEIGGGDLDITFIGECSAVSFSQYFLTSCESL